MTKDTKDTITSPHKKSPSPITTLVADPPPPSHHRSSPKSFSPSTLPPIIYEDPITKILEAENELRKAEENGDTKLEKVDLSELLEKDLQERRIDNTTVDDTDICKAGSSTAIVGNSIVQDMSRSTSFDTDYDNIQRLPSVADTTQNVSDQKGVNTDELPTTEEPNDNVRKEIFAAMVEEEKLMMMNSSPTKEEQKDTDLESQQIDNKTNGILQDANVRPTSPTNQGLPEVEAYLVDKDDVVIATPTQPWYKQKRMIMLISLAFIIAILSIVLGVTLSSSNNNESNENISSSNTATEEGVVKTTSSSSSIAPSSSTFSVFVPVSESVAPSPPSLATDLSDTDSQAPTPAPCYDININIKYDGYPAETSFQLYKVDDDGSKEIIQSHSAKDNDTFYNETMCLEEGMYAYTMFDADGICCSYGNGSYNITDTDGTLIVVGGEFKQVEMTKFSLPYVTDSPPPTEEVIPPDDKDECYQIEIVIEYDGYPAETSWELYRLLYDGGDDELVDSHAGSSGDTSFNQTKCLPEGEYNFTIIDADGICCSYGQGSYNITTPNGGVLAEGGEFTGSESSIFVFPFD